MKALDIRDVEPSDLVFIEESYLASAETAHSSGILPVKPWARDAQSWRDANRQAWRDILRRPKVRGLVAYKPGESSESAADLYGFLVWEEDYEDRKTREPIPYVVFTYIKGMYRGKRYRIEDRLFEAAGIDPLKPFHYAVKTPYLNRKAHFRRDCHRPLYVRFPPPQSQTQEIQDDSKEEARESRA